MFLLVVSVFVKSVSVVSVWVIYVSVVFTVVCVGAGSSVSVLSV